MTTEKKQEKYSKEALYRKNNTIPLRALLTFHCAVLKSYCPPLAGGPKSLISRRGCNLKLTFKAKPEDKVILISDSLPITKSNLKEMIFAGEKIYYDGTKATSKEGTLARSTTLLPDIIKRLAKQNLFNTEYINNTYKYHKIDLQGHIEWDDEWNIANIYLP